jgi:hypothetical protein
MNHQVSLEPLHLVYRFAVHKPWVCGQFILHWSQMSGDVALNYRRMQSVIAVDSIFLVSKFHGMNDPHSFSTGSEIYVGCSNGELLRFALQADDPNKVSNQLSFISSVYQNLIDFKQIESYNVLSRQTVPNDKPVDEIVLIPCISRALVLSGISVHLCCFLL